MSSKMVPKGNLAGWSPYVKIYDPLKAGSIDGTDLIPHDNAVVRAMSAKYMPPDGQKVTSDPSLTLFVGRLNLRTSEQQLSEEFSSYGPIKSCRLVQDIVTGMSRGYGFVEFKREADAQSAWKHAHGSTFHERKILVEWEFSRTMPGWIPRRLGGGLGGKKESGQLRFGGRDRPFKRPFILPPEEDLVKSPENACSTKLPDNNVKAKGEKEHESSSSRKTDTKESSFRSSYDDGKRKYGKYSEEKYSDRPYREEDKRKYRREADDKYLNRGSCDQHRKYGSDKVDMHADSSQHEEGRRNSRRYWEDRSVGFEEEDLYVKRNRRGDEDKFADSPREEGRKNSMRYVGDRSVGLEDDDQHRKKYPKENEDYYAHSSYYEESRRNSRRYAEEKSTECEDDSQLRKKYRKEHDNYANSSYYEEGRRNSRKYMQEKSTEYEDDQRRKKYRREHEDNYADSSCPRKSSRISRRYHDDRGPRYKEDDPSYYEDDRRNSNGYFGKSSVGYEGDSVYLKDDYYDESNQKSSSRYVEGQSIDDSLQLTKCCSKRRYEEPRKRIEKDIESIKYSYATSYYNKQSDQEICGSVSRISNYKATCNDHSKRGSSSDSSISARHKKHKKSKQKKKRHHSDSSETDSPNKSGSSKVHKKKRKKERRGEEEIEAFR